MATSINWPESLPTYVLKDSYSQAPVDNSIESEVDAGGFTIKRRRFTARIDLVSVAYHMTIAQRASFETFFHSTLFDGVLRFNWPDPDNSYSTREAQIVKDSVAVQPDGIEVKVSFQLRVFR